MELYLSGELAYSFQKMREMGALRAARAALAHQPVRHDLAQRALLRPRPAAEAEDARSRSRRSAPAPSPASGRANRAEKLQFIEQARQIQATLPMTQWEERDPARVPHRRRQGRESCVQTAVARATTVVATAGPLLKDPCSGRDRAARPGWAGGRRSPSGTSRPSPRNEGCYGARPSGRRRPRRRLSVHGAQLAGEVADRR